MEIILYVCTVFNQIARCSNRGIAGNLPGTRQQILVRSVNSNSDACAILEEFIRLGMVDTVTVVRRSEIMSRVRSKHTRPEIFVRQLLHKSGFRYRLHHAELPGKPDLVFPGRKKVIFIHGCFWHMHEGCSLARMPKSRVDFWNNKLCANRLRDSLNVKKLEVAGWAVLVVWECELQAPDLLTRLTKFLNGQTK